jgi:hypothetical protein
VQWNHRKRNCGVDVCYIGWSDSKVRRW